jgi:hypothetical protein
LGYVSEVSKSVLVANLPEASNVSVKFTYNFYTRDENIINGATATNQTSAIRTPGTATSPAGSSVINQNNLDTTYIVIPPEGTASQFIDSQLELRLAQSQFTLPRHMTLTWEKPNIQEIAEKLSVNVIADVPVNISDHINRIIYAETLGNQMFSGLVLQDLQVDNNFYRELSATIPIIASSIEGIVSTIAATDSDEDSTSDNIQTANRLIDNLKGFASADDLSALIEKFLPGEGEASVWDSDAKTQLASLMKNFQAEGIVYVSQDSIDKHADVLDEARNVIQNIVLKNTHAADLVLQASMGVETPYADDLIRAGTGGSSTLAHFDVIQADARAGVDDNGTTTAMFGLQVRAENLVQFYDGDSGYEFIPDITQPIDAPGYARQTSNGNNASIGLAGFLIDKKMSYDTDGQGTIDVNINNNSIIAEILNTGTDSTDGDGAAFGTSGSVVATEIRDGNIPYGARVIYRVRSVYYVEMDATNVQEDEDTIARVGILIASRGSHFVEAHAIEQIPPPPPQNLTFLYDYVNENVIVNWDFPVNSQRDITKFRLFKREHTTDFSGNIMNNTMGNVYPPTTPGQSTGSPINMPIDGNAYDKPFELIQEYDFNSTFNPGDYATFIDTPAAFDTNTYAQHLYTHTPNAPITRYVDTKFTKDSVAIYAVTSVDARGLSSNLSQQFEVSFDIRKNSIVVRYIAGSGAPLCYPNLNLTVQYDQTQFNDNISASPFSSLVKVSGLENVSIVFNPMYYKVEETPDIGASTIRDVIKFGGTIDGADDSVMGATPVYKLKILNIDVQKEKTIDIYINDNRSSAAPAEPSTTRIVGSDITEGRPSGIPYLVI